MYKQVNGKKVPLTEAEIAEFEAREAAHYSLEARQERARARRAQKYPSIGDQLDKIYHEGLAAWKLEIKAIKDANPIPQE